MNAHSRKATIYRMVMPDHICPFGLKSLDLLRREGFYVDDNWLKTREETDSFKAEHDVKTTPRHSSMGSGSAATTICFVISIKRFESQGLSPISR